MGLFDDWGKALSRPLQRTFQGFSQVFSNPAKANLGDFFSVAFPFVGGTIVSDIKHPQDVGFQAATLAAVAGGAYATGLTGGTAPWAYTPKAASPVFDANGFALTAGRPVPTLALSPEPGIFTLESAAWRAPTAAELAAQRGIDAAAPSVTSSVGSALASTGKAVKDVVMGTATLSVAARQIAQPWERAVETLRDAVAGQPTAAGPGGTQLSVTAGGSGAPGAAAPAIDTEAAHAPSNVPWGILVGLLALAGLTLLAVRWWKRRKA